MKNQQITQEKSQMPSPRARQSRMAQVWRFIVVFALALPTALGAMSGVAFAGTHTAVVGNAAASPPVGSYTGTNPQNNWPVTFFVSSDQKSLQDISIPYVGLTCTPGGQNLTDHLSVASMALSATGSFTSKTTQQGVLLGYPATFTYSFAGRYSGTNSSGVPTVTGTFSESITSTDPSALSCTSNSQSWTATRDNQPAQPASAPPVGSYTATNPQNNWPVTFFVSSNRKSLQDVSIPYVGLNCTPGGQNLTDHLWVASVALTAAGSFTSTTTQHGVIDGYPATFTYAFRGNFHGVNASGAARAAGTFTETIKYTDSTARDCTSNAQSWTAARDNQPAQPASAPPVGSYTATNPQNNWPVTFFVSSNRKSLQDVSIPYVGLNCTPGGQNLTDHLWVASVALTAAGSFTSTTTQHGVIDGYPATFTYAFRGNVHGVNASGAARAAGTFTETIKYTDSTARDCTSNAQSWTAARDNQPAQPASAPPVGSYTATNPQNNWPVTFKVSSNRKSLQDISIPYVGLNCTPGGQNLTESLSIPSAALNSSQAFSATRTQSGVVDGYPATFTYNFRGNVHGVNASGAARAAGTFTETVKYTDSTARDCTSNAQSWTASKTA